MVVPVVLVAEDLRMWYAARIFEGSFCVVSLAEGYVAVRRSE